MQVFANKGGILRTETDFEGIILKGVGADYDWSFFKDFLVEGKLPTIKSDKTSREILISDDIARRLQLKVGDKARTYFIKPDASTSANPSIPRAFMISGIYDSGLEEYDTKFIIGDLRHIQKINKWKPDQVGKFEVFISDFDSLDEIGNKIWRDIDSQLMSQTIKQEYPNIFSWLALLDGNIYIIIAVILIVGIISITNLISCRFNECHYLLPNKNSLLPPSDKPSSSLPKPCQYSFQHQPS